MTHVTPPKLKTFRWWDAIERGLWSGVQAPAGVAIADQVIVGTDIPAASYWIAAGAAIGISILKTVGQERMRFLDTRSKR